jgi:hypothetical protein
MQDESVGKERMQEVQQDGICAVEEGLEVGDDER